MNRALSFSYLFATLAVAVTLFGPYAQANDKLLDETVEFTGTILFCRVTSLRLSSGSYAMARQQSLALAKHRMDQANRLTDAQCCVLGH